ncbi:MAG: sugar phosphate nucleotidyltransferase [Promethearchaeati archaeon SRVP18_Atabeyarchaeia-1]
MTEPRAGKAAIRKHGVFHLKYEAIILCGGEGWRLKPDEWTPKPLLKITETESLLDMQVRWLVDNGFDNIVLASNRSFPESDMFTSRKVQMCTERKKLGTGGAVKRAAVLIDTDRFYVMNVDDVAFYDPRTLYDRATTGAAILLAKPRLPFGKVTLQGDDIVKGFEHRPILDMWVSAGHYVFSSGIVEKYFPAYGDFEHTAMQQIAGDNLLRGLKYPGDWLTLNTAKDLIAIQEYMKNMKVSRKHG